MYCLYIAVGGSCDSSLGGVLGPSGIDAYRVCCLFLSRVMLPESEYGYDTLHAYLKYASYDL